VLLGPEPRRLLLRVCIFLRVLLASRRLLSLVTAGVDRFVERNKQYGCKLDRFEG
jgi:hypothetical protein